MEAKANQNFKLYWMDERTGHGYQAKDYPDVYTYEQAYALVKQNNRHPKQFSCRLRYEPLELWHKYTSTSEQI